MGGIEGKPTYPGQPLFVCQSEEFIGNVETLIISTSFCNNLLGISIFLSVHLLK
jgi:hypothetical protein